MRELVSQWYVALSALSSWMAPLLTQASASINIPFASAFLLGLLGAASPCQLTTNTSALALLGTGARGPRRTAVSALAYLAGKAAVYTALGTAAVLLGLQLATAPVPLIATVRRALGPLMILIGLVMLGAIKPKFLPGPNTTRWLDQRNLGAGTGGPFALGVLFGLAFCPTLLWLFFGLLVPLSLTSRGGLLLPAVFALGTTLPLVVLVGLVALGAPGARGYLGGLVQWERWGRRVAGLVVIAAGVNDTLTYWFI